MHRAPLPILLTLILLAGSAPHAWGAPGKLDARARAALAGLRAGGQSIAAMRARGLAVSRDGALDVFIRGPATRAQLEAAGARVRTALASLATASLPVSALARVQALPGVLSIHGGVPCEPELDVSVATTGAQTLRGAGPNFTGLNGQGVIIGVVDSGVDFDHGDFKDAAGATRISSLWDQTLPGSGPPPFSYGIECTRAQIDAGTCAERDSLEHGTHMTGIAAGDGSQTAGAKPPYTYVGMAPRADLIVVKTDFETPEVIDAIAYVFNRAAAAGKNAVVNLSLGTQFGSHDGASEFEQAIAELTGPGRIVVKSAGNDRGKAIHGRVFATAGGAVATLSVSSSAAGRTFEIDGYYNATERLRVQVTTPNGTIIGPVGIGDQNAEWPGTSTPNGLVYVAQDSTSALAPRNVIIEAYCEVANQPLNGTWTIKFFADQLGAANGRVDFWRYFATSGLTANVVTGNLPTQNLITEPGNSDSVITAGAWVTKTTWTACNGVANSYAGTPAVGNLATFSSPGPTRDGRQKPDLAAPGTAVASTTSWDIPHTCPGSPAASEFVNDGMNHRVLQGTSVAAPHVAGAVALLMQSRGALTPGQVRTYLRTNAHADAFTGAVPSVDWGYGKLAMGDLVLPLVSLVSPNGGETAVPGTVMTITWTASDVGGSVPSVDLALSRTGPGGPFAAIATGIANSGSFPWTVTYPNTIGSVAYVRVTAHDLNQNTASDLSDAGFTIAGPVAVEDGGGAAFALSPIRPNPTAHDAQIDFSLAREAPVRLRVLDLEGRTVRTLAEGVLPAGRHQIRWQPGRDGSPAPAGLYFVLYETPAGRYVRRVAVAR